MEGSFFPKTTPVKYDPDKLITKLQDFINPFLVLLSF